MSTTRTGIEIINTKCINRIILVDYELISTIDTRFSTESFGVFGGDSVGVPTTVQLFEIKPSPNTSTLNDGVHDDPEVTMFSGHEVG